MSAELDLRSRAIHAMVSMVAACEPVNRSHSLLVTALDSIAGAMGWPFGLYWGLRAGAVSALAEMGVAPEDVEPVNPTAPPADVLAVFETPRVQCIPVSRR